MIRAPIGVAPKVISNQCVSNQFRGSRDKAGEIITDH